jgi:medium-chain acyl-[acyl-carrier-protein] hydrolase
MDTSSAPCLLAERFTISTFDRDWRGRIPLAVLCRCLQEAAEHHACHLGVGMPQLRALNLTWVLLSLRLRLSRRPGNGAHIDLETWPAGADRRFAERDFRLFADDAPEPVGLAASRWMVLDVDTNRPVPMPEGVLALRPPARPRAFPDDDERLASLTRAEFEKTFPVRLSDLDINRHVNNVHYIEWLTESVPQEVWSEMTPVELSITFRAPAVYGDVVLARSVRRTDAPETTFLHGLADAASGRELVRGRTVWRKDGD